MNLKVSAIGGGAVAAAFAMNRNSSSGIKPGDGYSLVGGPACASGLCFQAEFRNNFATLVDMSWTPNAHWLVVAVELQSASGTVLPAPTATPAPTPTSTPTPTRPPLLPTATPVPPPTPVVIVPTATPLPPPPTAVPPTPAPPVNTPGPVVPPLTVVPPTGGPNIRPPTSLSTATPTPTPVSPVATATPGNPSPTPVPAATPAPKASGCNGSAPDLAWLGILGMLAVIPAVRLRRSGRNQKAPSSPEK